MVVWYGTTTLKGRTDQSSSKATGSRALVVGSPRGHLAERNRGFAGNETRKGQNCNLFEQRDILFSRSIHNYLPALQAPWPQSRCLVACWLAEEL